MQPVPDATNRPPTYRGRIAPSPTGFLHLGHARTFWMARERARAHHGVLVLRNEDLDGPRCKPEFVSAMTEDLRWFGFNWQEGPDVGGEAGPYAQSARVPRYQAAFRRLVAGGFVYPCACSRRDIQQAASAPHEGGDELLYPGTCRPAGTPGPIIEPEVEAGGKPANETRPSWRFHVAEGRVVEFADGLFGPQRFVAGRDFSDFVIWRQDHLPAYQLACVVDDHEMAITEVVRGSDLLISTARQLLIYEALGWRPPAFFHCPLMTDEAGERLAKRHDALSLRQLRAAGCRPEEWIGEWYRDLRGAAPVREALRTVE